MWLPPFSAPAPAHPSQSCTSNPRAGGPTGIRSVCFLGSWLWSALQSAKGFGDLHSLVVGKTSLPTSQKLLDEALSHQEPFITPS